MPPLPLEALDNPEPECTRGAEQHTVPGAAKLFEQSVSRQPQDYLSAMYLARCRTLIETPPGENWNGVFVMTKK